MDFLSECIRTAPALNSRRRGEAFDDRRPLAHSPLARSPEDGRLSGLIEGATADAPAPPYVQRRPWWRQLYGQVLIATLLGIAFGHFFPKTGDALQPLGDAFIQAIRMIIAPVIFCTVVAGIARMGDLRRVGRVALKAIAYFEIATTMALVLALFAVNVLRPGAGMHVDPASISTDAIKTYAAQANQTSVSGFLLHIIPSSAVGAFAAGDVLQVLFFSVLFAFALVLVGEPGKPMLILLDAASKVLFRVVGIIMLAAPIASFGAMAFTVGHFGIGSLISLGRLLLEFYAVCAIFILIGLGLAARIAGVSILRLMLYLRAELLIILATTSSETVLPQLMEKMTRAGCDASVVGLVVPTGYSFNLDGTCLYLATAAIFLAQATDTPLTLPQQLGLLVILLLTSKGAAGIAGAAFVVLAATLASTGTIPLAAIALVLGIHRFMSMALTFTNVMGNAVATILVSAWEGALDREQLRATLGERR
jgi:aerobic C4-dicarboxylate transport protein